MADNIQLNAGTGGKIVRTDDDGSAHWQYVKLAFGADNTQTIVSHSNDLPVVAASQTDRAYDGSTSCTIKRFNIIATSDGDTIISAPTGTKKIRIRSFAIIAMSTTESEVYFQTATTGTDTIGNSTNGFLISMDASADNVGGIKFEYNPDGWFETSDADEALQIKMSSNQPMLVCGTYIEVA